MRFSSRRKLVFGLVGIFLVQTWMIYTDPAGRSSPPLSDLAKRGQQLWLGNNCQSCHQLFGFGGFLGPDLTNAAQRLTSARIETMLTEGAGRMPPFHMNPDDCGALEQFLRELDGMGVGQARIGDITPPRDLLAELIETTAPEDEPLSPLEEQGRAIMFEQNCINCHLPNSRSAYRAPDVTMLASRIGRERLAATLAEGVPGKPMPRFVFTTEQVDAVHAVLERLVVRVSRSVPASCAPSRLPRARCAGCPGSSTRGDGAAAQRRLPARRAGHTRPDGQRSLLHAAVDRVRCARGAVLHRARLRVDDGTRPQPGAVASAAHDVCVGLGLPGGSQLRAQVPP